MDAVMDHSTINERVKARVAAMTDAQKEAFVESVYEMTSPSPEVLDEFTLIMRGGNGPADAAEK